jgi:phosphoribosyl 1,2-cyclic phosphate phosphodiesterase
LKIKFIGTSDTAGLPVHGCDCSACRVYRQRKRFNSPSCAYIELEDGVIFIDSGSDEFIKIRDGKRYIAQFLTHFHADHAYGLLRLRHTSGKTPLFHPKDERGFGDLYKRPHGFIFKENRPFEVIKVEGLEFVAIPLVHSRPTHGYMVVTKRKKIAYLTDCSALSDESMEFLKKENLDAVFIDASYDADFDEGKHLSFTKAIALIDELGAKEGFLIHQSHYSLSYVLDHNLTLKYPYISEGFEYEI